MMWDPLSSADHERTTGTHAGGARVSQLALVRVPVVLCLGAGDLTVTKVGKTVTGARVRAEQAIGKARQTYLELAERGELTLRRIQSQPRVADVLRNVADATERLDIQVEFVVDEMHDASEEALGRMSLETMAARERAARVTQRFARDAVDTVTGRHLSEPA